MIATKTWADCMFSKLADWDDDDPSLLPDTSSRWDKVVILKHMFTLQELEVGSLLIGPAILN
jgi:hypothetical protein